MTESIRTALWLVRATSLLLAGMLTTSGLSIPPVEAGTPGRPGQKDELGGFIGAKRCKLCHRDIYLSWSTTPHARPGPELAEGSERCRSCHATGDGRLTGVQCEACHGPGADYWPAEVMIDPDKARMAGLSRPGVEVCRRCHENQEPGHARGFAIPTKPLLRQSVH